MAGDDGVKKWRVVDGPPSQTPSSQAGGAPASGGPPALDWSPVSPPSGQSPATAPVFYATRKRNRTFAFVTVGIVVVAGLGYVAYDQYVRAESTTFHDAPTYVLSSAQSFVSQVIDNEALRGFFYQVPYECDCPVDGVTLHVPPDVLPDGAVVDVGGVDRERLPLPAGNRAASALVQVDVAGIDAFDGHLRVSIPVADGMAPERVVAVAFDRVTGTWDAAGPVSFDSGSVGPTVLVEIVQPTAVALVEVPATPAPAATAFQAGRNGWTTANDAMYLEPGGNSLGMSSFAKWLFQRTTTPLSNGYASDVPALLDDRVHLAQAGAWEGLINRTTLTGEASLGVRLAGMLAMTQFPQVLLAGSPAGASAAVLVTGFDGQGFTVYDADMPGQTGRIAWTTQGGFAEYRGHTRFGLTGLTAVAPESSLGAFHQSADSGALVSGDLSLTAPTPGASVDAGLVVVAGAVSGALSDVADEVVVYVGAARFVAPVTNDRFSVNVPVDQIGAVDIFVVAGPAPAERSPLSAATRTHVERDPGVLFLVTLTWDQAGTDVDLYVTEADGETKYYANKVGNDGGVIDQDVTGGRGPEHYTLDPTQGHRLDRGQYTIRVHYYSASGSELPATGTVSWVDYSDPQRPRSDRVPFYIAVADSGSSSPGQWTNASWVTIGAVTL